MSELLIHPNSALDKNGCAQMRTTLTKACCFLTLPPAAQSTLSTLRHITVTNIEGKTNLSIPLATCKNEDKASLALLLLNVSGELEKHPRNDFSCLYLFPDGFMFAHWSNIILGKNFFGENERPDDFGGNIHIEFFGDSHHHQLRFLKGLGYVFDICPHLKIKPTLTFA